MLRDTLGDGLETFPYFDLLVASDEEELAKYVNAAFEYLLEENGYEPITSVAEYEKDVGWPIGQEIVVAQFVNSIGGKEPSAWMREKLSAVKKKKDDEDYQLYLKLKEKFEP